MPTAEQAVNYQSAHPELRINPYQREAVRLRRVGEEQTALNYERQQQAAQQKHDWAMEAATGAARGGRRRAPKRKHRSKGGTTRPFSKFSPNSASTSWEKASNRKPR